MTSLNNNNSHTVNQNQINNNNTLTKDNNIMKDLSGGEPMDHDQDQPDADYIKMFVGQVPRSMDEKQLRDMFEEFGRVHTINVLRDKTTGLSKGESRSAFHADFISLCLRCLTHAHASECNDIKCDVCWLT